MSKEGEEAFAAVSALLVIEFCVRHHIDPNEVIVTWRQHCDEHDHVKPHLPDDIDVMLDDANWSYAVESTAREFCAAAFKDERKR